MGHSSHRSTSRSIRSSLRPRQGFPPVTLLSSTRISSSCTLHSGEVGEGPRRAREHDRAYRLFSPAADSSHLAPAFRNMAGVKRQLPTQGWRPRSSHRGRAGVGRASGDHYLRYQSHQTEDARGSLYDPRSARLDADSDDQRIRPSGYEAALGTGSSAGGDVEIDRHAPARRVGEVLKCPRQDARCRRLETIGTPRHFAATSDRDRQWATS